MVNAEGLRLIVPGCTYCVRKGLECARENDSPKGSRCGVCAAKRIKCSVANENKRPPRAMRAEPVVAPRRQPRRRAREAEPGTLAGVATQMALAAEMWREGLGILEDAADTLRRIADAPPPVEEDEDESDDEGDEGGDDDEGGK